MLTHLPPLHMGELNKMSEIARNSPPRRGAGIVGGVVVSIVFEVNIIIK